MISLQTLGGLRLHGADLGQRLPLLVLAYLVIEGPTERQHLRGLFWPGAQSQGNNMRVVLAKLRATLPGLALSGDVLRAELPCDALQLAQAPDPEALYQGAFLQGVSLNGLGEELYEWVCATRERLALDTQYALIARAEGSSPAEAARLAAQVLAVPGAASPDPELLARLYPLALPGSLLARQLDGARRELDLEGAWPPHAGRPQQVAAPLPGRLLGRGAEVSQVLAWLGAPPPGGPRLVQLSGPSGSGKSLLAGTVLLERQRLGGEVLHLDLEVLRDELDVAARVAQTLGLQVEDQGDPWLSLAQALDARTRQAPLLLALDGADGVAGLDMAVPRLLAAAPGVQVLLTRRAPLWEGPAQLRLGGLALPGLTDPDLLLAQNPAVQLFLRSAGPELRADQEGALPLVAALVRRLQGLPLAVQLVGGWTRQRPLAEVHAAVESEQAAGPELGTLLAPLLARTWDLLRPAEQELLARLAGLPDWSLDSAREVAGLDGPARAALLASGLLLEQGGRVQVLPLLARWLAGARPAPEGGRALQAAHYLDLLRRLDPADPLLRDEAGNLGLLLGWQLAQEAAPEAAEDDLLLVARLGAYFERRGRLSAGVRALETLEVQAAAPQVRLALAAQRAWLAFRSGRHRDAEGLSRRVLDAPPATRPLRVQMWASNVLAVTLSRQGRGGEAAEFLRQAATLARQLGDGGREALYLGNLALLLKDLGEYAEALEALRAAQAYHRRWGQPEHAHFEELRVIEVRLDDPQADPLEVWEAARALELVLQGSGDQMRLGTALYLQARAALRAGDPGAALRLAAEVHRAHETFPDPTFQAAAWITEAEAHYALFRTPEARRALRLAAQACLDLGDEVGLLEVLLVLAADLRYEAPAFGEKLLAVVARHPRSNAAQRRRAARSPGQEVVSDDLRALVTEGLAQFG
ncbi:ATP-binding protein [uncultured Deinococcus sp.]|uniref:ATP-binding protein n=1 Tax=uncultured Deinococcus sp. TaxID=158789 RepID=UPI0025867B8B|nr:ATP-binding protein [uncultured Deinococcus sp.]